MYETKQLLFETFFREYTVLLDEASRLKAGTPGIHVHKRLTYDESNVSIGPSVMQMKVERHHIESTRPHFLTKYFTSDAEIIV